MIKLLDGDMIYLTHVEYGGIYDFNIKTKQLSTVLKLHHNDNSVTYSRFDFTYYEKDYMACTENDLIKYGRNYYLENGTQPFLNRKALNKFISSKKENYNVK